MGELKPWPGGFSARGEYFYKHRERGPKKFYFTYQDVADLTGQTVWAVKKHATTTSKRPIPILQMTNLGSVVSYINSHKLI